MSPSKKRKTTKVDLVPYLQEDVITVKPKADVLHIEVGQDRCRTVVTDETATIQFILTLFKQGKAAWGNPFIEKVLTGVQRV